MNNQTQAPPGANNGPGKYQINRWLIVGAIILVIAAIAAIIGMTGSDPNETQAVFSAKQGPLTISVVESGTINHTEKEIIKSRVEGKNTILSLVAEGTAVQKGDLLIQLDSSRLEEQRTQQQIKAFNAEAAFIRSREQLAVAKSQARSDVAKAELEYKFARADLKKYIEGEYPKELQTAEADINIAREELQRALDKYQWSQQLEAEGYINRTELQADELQAKRKKLNVELAENTLRLLTDYTYPRKLEELESDIEQAEMALERIKRKARADVVQAEADLKAKEAEFNQQTAKLEKVNEQIRQCRITSPVDSVVVYATTGQFRWRGNREPLEEGQEVHEGQELIHLPMTTSMMAEVKVHESSLMKVKNGLPVRVTVDALPGREFQGRVAKIGMLPDPVSAWLNPDLKVYSTEIHLDGNGEGLRPGMSCRAEIIVEEIDDAVYVPVQSVVRVGGKPVVYIRSGGSVDLREVKIGMDNNRMVHVLNGLTAGDAVLLAPPLAQSVAPMRAARPAAPRENDNTANPQKKRGRPKKSGN